MHFDQGQSMVYPNNHTTNDVVKFWQPRPPVLREAVAPYLLYPVMDAAIEQCFCLAGLIGVKKQQKWVQNCVDLV